MGVKEGIMNEKLPMYKGTLPKDTVVGVALPYKMAFLKGDLTMFFYTDHDKTKMFGISYSRDQWEIVMEDIRKILNSEIEEINPS